MGDAILDKYKMEEVIPVQAVLEEKSEMVHRLSDIVMVELLRKRKDSKLFRRFLASFPKKQGRRCLSHQEG